MKKSKYLSILRIAFFLGLFFFHTAFFGITNKAGSQQFSNNGVVFAAVGDPAADDPFGDGSDFQATENLTKETLDSLNPLKMVDENGVRIANQGVANKLTTPGAVVSRVLEYAFPMSGLILFVMIVWGGVQILVGAADKKSMDSGKQRITAAIVGFAILFVSYWVMQILSFIFGIVIL